MAQSWDTALLATDGSNQIPPWYKMWKNRFVSAKVQASTLKRSWCREASAVLAAMDVAYTWVCSTCHTSGVHIAYSWKGYKPIFICYYYPFKHPNCTLSIENHPPNRDLPKKCGFVCIIPSMNKTCSNRVRITPGQFPIQPFAKQSGIMSFSSSSWPRL
jgi:hypothetical protein